MNSTEMYNGSIRRYCLSRRPALGPQDRNPVEITTVFIGFLSLTLDHIPVTR